MGTIEADKHHISLKTSKLLDTKIKSRMVFKNVSITEVVPIPDSFFSRILGFKFIYCERSECQYRTQYKAFTWQEILWEHAEEFFGGIEPVKMGAIICQIVFFLQDHQFQKADEFFRENCVLIKK